MDHEKKVFKKIWGIPEGEERFLSLVYEYSPKFFSWLGYITVIAAIGTIAKITQSKPLEIITFISTMVFYAYTFTLASTVLRHYVQKIRNINIYPKLFLILAVLVAIIGGYGLFKLQAGISEAINIIIERPASN